MKKMLSILLVEETALETLQDTIHKYVSSSNRTNPGMRPLNIDFDAHTDGDANFKKELISLMVADLTELKKSFADALVATNADIYIKGCHKTNTTIDMINDPELIELVDELKAEMKTGTGQISAAKSALFNRLIEDIIESLSVV